MNLFISGWAGFKEALQDVPEDWNFINPFIDFDERGILDFLKYKSGDIVVGWSTGGHIILKNLKFFAERFDKIMVVAGFKRFTKYVNPQILKRMIQKMQIDYETVLRDFLINAGCYPIATTTINYHRLIEGLNFLFFSEVVNIYDRVKNLVLIHGLFDKILPIKALYDLKNIYPSAQTYIVEKPHWITFNEIMKSLRNS